MKCMKYIATAAVTVAVLMLPQLGSAQDTRATIVGTVKDQAGAAMAGTEVLAENTGTNVIISATADATGNYEIPYLNPGIYNVTVEVAGFEKFERRGLELRISDHATVDVVLHVGKNTETVVVGGSTPLLDMQSEAIGTVIDQKSIQDLPVSGGNLATLAPLSPMVNYLGAANNYGTYNASSDISVAGMRAYNTEFVIDGSPAMQNGTVAYQPPVDMVQQARTIVSVYDAAYGHSAGGYHVESTRSGLNAVHGTLYEYFTSNVLLSLDYFQRVKLATEPSTELCPSDPSNPVRCIKGKVVYNRFGGSLGGPIVIPKLYNGRDKAFWFVAYERNPATNSSPNAGFQFTVPTLAERNGDFSALLAYFCSTDHNSTVAVPLTGQCANGDSNPFLFVDPTTHKPYPYNKITYANASELQTPQALAAAQYLQYYPMPNGPGDAEGNNDYVRPESSHGTSESFSSRIDYVFSPRDRVFGRFNHSDGASYNSGAFNNASSAYIASNHTNAMAIDNVLIFSASLLMDARYSFTREVSPVVNTPTVDLTSLDLPQSLVNQVPPQLSTFPRINIDSGDYEALGIGETNPSLTTNYHAANVDFTKEKDRHTVRFGGQFRVYQNNNTDETSSTYPVPSLSFSSNLTGSLNSNGTIIPQGAGLASFLLGYPTAGTMYKLAYYAITSKYMSGYVQDDIRATSRLTLNAGLLYEYETAPTERHNRLVRGFDSTDPNPISGIAAANYQTENVQAIGCPSSTPPCVLPSKLQVNGGLLFAGVNGNPRTLWSTDKNNFAPRFGAAFRINDSTVLRGGYGIYYMPKGADRMSNQNPADTAAPVQNGFQTETSFQVGTAIISGLNNPFPTGILPQTGSTLGLGTGLGQTISFLPTHIVNPLIQRVTFGVQRQLPKGILIEVGYGGTFAHNLYTTRQLDAIPDQYLSTSPTRDDVKIAQIGKAVPNPFLPAIGNGSSLSNPTLYIFQLITPYPEFNGISYPEDNGSSNYNAGYVRGERRFASGWSLLGNYTWSKWMQRTEYLNAGDAAPTHVISDLDIPQKFALTGLYDIPVGRGRRFGSNWNKYLAAVVGGWQAGMILYGQSGVPIGFGDDIYIGDYHNITLPNSQKTAGKWFNNTGTCNNGGTIGTCTNSATSILTSGWEKRTTDQRADDIRTFPLRLPEVRAEGQTDANANLTKYFDLPRQARLQIRVEGYNAFNHSQFAAPNTTVTSSLFGQISSVQSVARQIYFVAKIIF